MINDTSIIRCGPFFSTHESTNRDVVEDVATFALVQQIINIAITKTGISVAKEANSNGWASSNLVYFLCNSICA